MSGSQPKSRRFAGTHLTVIAVAFAVVVVPSLAYASYHAVSILGDPYNSAVYARLSEDGRLGVRGETTAQQGVQSNAWSAIVSTAGTSADLHLLRAAPPGGGLGVGQLTVGWTSRESGSVRSSSAATTVQVVRTLPSKVGCLSRRRAIAWDAHEDGYQIVYEAKIPTPSTVEHGYTQLLFPIPLTAQPSPEGMCLYVRSNPRDALISANGIEGPSTPAFAPAKGEPATQHPDGGETNQG